MIDVNLNALLREYRSNPYEEYRVETPHTGIISFKVRAGEEVKGPSGQWMERPGSMLFTLEREKNLKEIRAEQDGKISYLREELEGSFVEAREHVVTIRHRLDKEEIINKILKRVLAVFPAPETARYYLAPELEALREQKKEISVKPGDEILVMSLMKRDTSIRYDGPPGIAYRVYFHSGDMVLQGEPLIGVARAEDMDLIQKIIQRIRSEWED